MVDQNVTQLTEATTVADTDLVYTVVDPAGTPLDRKVSGSNLKSAMRADNALFGSVFKTGERYGELSGSRGGSTLSNNRAYASPFIVGRTNSFDEIGLDLTEGGGGTTVLRLMVYADDGTGFPGTLTLDAGTVAADASGFKAIVLSPTLELVPGIYWLAAMPEGANVSARIISGAVYPVPRAGGIVNRSGWNRDFGPGAEATWPTSFESLGPGPAVLLKAA